MSRGRGGMGGHVIWIFADLHKSVCGPLGWETGVFSKNLFGELNTIERAGQTVGVMFGEVVKAVDCVGRGSCNDPFFLGEGAAKQQDLLRCVVVQLRPLRSNDAGQAGAREVVFERVLWPLPVVSGWAEKYALVARQVSPLEPAFGGPAVADGADASCTYARGHGLASCA